jgi:chloride channel protein, CIC family
LNYGTALDRLLSSLRRLPYNSRVLVYTIVCGAFAGAAAVAFMVGINYLFDRTYVEFSRYPAPYFLAASFLTIMGSSLAVGLLLYRFSPESAGSGIPQLKAAYWKEIGYVPFLPVLVKFVAGILSIGGGASLGREGPTVYIGGGIASNVAGALGIPVRQRRFAVVIGAAAGLAAAFNAPLAAVTFILEEFVGDLNSRFIGRVVLAALIGAFVVYALLGRQPAFKLPSVEEISWVHYVLAPLVAAVAAATGSFFQKATLSLRGSLLRQKTVPPWLLPCCGGFLVWIIGASVYYSTGKFGVFGLGYHDLSSALENDYIWWVAGIMVAAKLAATILSYGFGACGGVFSPTLFLGGMCGYFIGALVNFHIPLTPSDRIILSAVGMSTCLGAVVRAPLTSMLIVFEMTHQFAFVPGLMIGAVVSVVVSHAFGRQNFYDAILLQDGHELIKIRPPLDIKSWQKLPISSIANRKPVIVRSTEASHLKEILDSHPYRCFPFQADGDRLGLITREQMASLLAGGKSPAVSPAVVCSPDQSVRDISARITEAPHDFIILLDEKTGEIAGIVTLHDLLRAQQSILDEHGGDAGRNPA